MRCTWRGASEAHASCEVLGRSILPETIEAVGAQLGISHRVRDVAVAEVVLERAGVDAITARLEYLLVPLVFGLGAPLVALVGTNVGAGEHKRASPRYRPTWSSRWPRRWLPPPRARPPR